MEKEEFIGRLKRAGFKDEGDGDFYKQGPPYWHMNINEEGAFCSYNWGGDTGPIEITDTRVSIDRMAEELDNFGLED